MSRFVVYTAVFENYDFIHAPKKSADIDYICFTDNEFLPKLYKNWNIIIDTSSTSGALKNRKYKFYPHEVLNEYEASLYVDGNIKLVGDVTKLFLDFMESGDDIWLTKHIYRQYLSEEIDECNKLKMIAPQKYYDLIKFYEIDPTEIPLAENNIMIVRHDSVKLPIVSDKLWQCLRHIVARDQLFFIYLLEKFGVKYSICMKNSRTTNEYFKYCQHSYGYNKYLFIFYLLYLSLKKTKLYFLNLLKNL